MKNVKSTITASIFWDRTKDALKKNFTGYIKYKTVTNYLHLLFTEWKGVEKSYIKEIEALESKNDALTEEIEALNHVLTQRNNLVYLNALLDKELNYYKRSSNVNHIPIDGEPLSSQSNKSKNKKNSCHVLQFPQTVSSDNTSLTHNQ